MGYLFPCHRCHALIRISNPKPETKYRCPNCRAKVKYVARRSTPSVSLEALEYGASPRTLRIAIAALIVAILSAAGLGYHGYRSNKIRVDEFARLEQSSIAQIAEARKQARAFSFKNSDEILSNAESPIVRSSFLTPQNKAILLDRLSTARAELSQSRKEYERKIKEGYALVDGRLVAPDELAQAIEQKRRQEDAEKAMREAEALAHAEAEDKEREIREAEQRAIEEAERKRREQEKAQSGLKEELRELPAIEDVLNGFEFSLQRTKMKSALLSKRLAEVDPSRPFDAREFTIGKDEVLRHFRELDVPAPSPVMAFRDDIVGYLGKLEFAAYLKCGNAAKPEYLPARLASYLGQPALLLGAVYSEIQFDDSLLGMATPEQRAAEFLRRTVLPALPRRSSIGSARSPRLKYLGIAFAYANRNSSRNDRIAEPEFLCVLMPIREFASLGRKGPTPEELMRKSAFFLASRDEKIRQVEITLD